VQDLLNELQRQIRENPDIVDYTVVDADGETIDSVRPDEAYEEMALEF
jgi:hypothetical protein